MDYEGLRVAAQNVLSPISWQFFSSTAGDDPDTDHFAWQRLRIVPNMFAGLCRVDASVALPSSVHRGGAELRSPFFIAPTAAQRLAHADAEIATGTAAESVGSLMIYSSSATTEVTVFGHNIASPWWAQVYLMKDRGLSRDYVDRAVAAGAGALVLTLDYPGAIASPAFRSATRSQMGVRPANYPSLDWSGMADEMDPALSTEHIALLADWSGLPVHVKGILRPSNAALAVDEGAAGVIVSNHGRRQVPGVVSTANVLADVVDAVGGRAPVLVDGGIRSGADAVRAISLGASLVGVGRAVLWGLSVNGRSGVEHVLTELVEELRNTMASCGASTLSALDRDYVRSAD
ncbi:alpha-hydroxy acid oxidase [Rathayibacter sp. CAU 1779]